MAKGEVFIGTSGWQYRHWRGNFYPTDLAQKDWLRFYSQHFNTVEVNSSFYRQTSPAIFEKWLSETLPAQTDLENFVFSVKGNRYITHIKRLKGCEEPLKKFFENAEVLVRKDEADKASSTSRTRNEDAKHVILWQLPPSLKVDVDRVKNFISLLPKNFRYAFEFRHKSWVPSSVHRALYSEDKQVALVLQDWNDWPKYEKAYGNFVYIRFHGKDQLYTSDYSDTELANWAKKARKWVNRRLDVYAYFNNDTLGYAVPNALTLRKLTRLFVSPLL